MPAAVVEVSVSTACCLFGDGARGKLAAEIVGVGVHGHAGGS